MKITYPVQVHLATVTQLLPQYMRQRIEYSRYIRFRQRATLLNFTPHIVRSYLSIVRDACMELFLVRLVRRYRILVPFKMNCHSAVFIYTV